MAQHFLLSAKARTLPIAAVMRMTNLQVEATFKAIRWARSEGRPMCVHCECPIVYEARRSSGALRFRCKACQKDFSLTSGTLFAFHKMPLRTYLASIAIFCNEVKGKSALALSRDLGVQYKTAFVLAHKLREAMACEVKGYQLGGPSKIVEIDGGYFGGYVKPSNRKKNRRDRRLTKNQNGKRQCVVVIRERDGHVLPAAFRSEGAALTFIRNRVARETEIMVDESAAWRDLSMRYSVKVINHSVGFSLDGACTNGAESFFSRIRRAERGHYHHIAGVYLGRYAQESAWRENHRRMASGAQAQGIAALAMASKPSVDFCGYWQRAH